MNFSRIVFHSLVGNHVTDRVRHGEYTKFELRVSIDTLFLACFRFIHIALLKSKSLNTVGTRVISIVQVLAFGRNKVQEISFSFFLKA